MLRYAFEKTLGLRSSADDSESPRRSESSMSASARFMVGLLVSSASSESPSRIGMPGPYESCELAGELHQLLGLTLLSKNEPAVDLERCSATVGRRTLP